MKILVVEATALHLGFLGCYGNDWVGTPELDRLAAEGIVFDQHFIACPDLTGNRSTAPSLAGAAMYGFGETAAEASSPALPARVVSIEAIRRFGKTASELVDECCADGPPILWIDGPALAPPWRLSKSMLGAYLDPEEDDRPPLPDPAVGLGNLEAADFTRLQATYAAVVTAFDAELGRLLRHLRRRRLIDQLLVCVTARCGLPLGEHGVTGLVRAWMHDELTHIPLVMRLPDAVHAGMRVAALTQAIDVAPTLLEHLGLNVPDVHGRPLGPLIRGHADEIRPYAVSGLRIGGSAEWLLRTSDLALLLPSATPPGDPPRSAQLYVKPDDRWEVNDGAPRHSDEVEALKSTLDAFVAAIGQPGPLAYPPLPTQRLSQKPLAPEHGGEGLG